MLQALLHGKLSREQENMEDVLTSNVFGLLRYLPPDQGLYPLLAHARTIKGEYPLERLVGKSSALPPITEVKYSFWERLHEPGRIFCESDLMIRIRVPDHRALLILIEAKYRSPKSSKASSTETRPKDQLAREWDNLVGLADREDATPFLIYTTASVEMPKQDIRDSVADYVSKRDRHDTPTILWLSWRQITEVFGSERQVPILKDLCELTERMGLTYFHGFCTPGVGPREPRWVFDPIPQHWFDCSTVPVVDWEFTR